MKKLALSLVLLMGASCFAVAADTPTASLYSLTRHYAITPNQEKGPGAQTMFRMFRKPAPLLLSWHINTTGKQQKILNVTPDNISITDADGNALEWSLSDETAIPENLVHLEIETQPKGDWIEIKGALKVSLSEQTTRQPQQTVKYGESGKLNIPGMEMSYEWKEGEDIRFTLPTKDKRKVADIHFKTPEGKKVRISCQYSGTGMQESSFGYDLETDAKEIFVVVETYNEPTTVSIPLNARIGFSGELKQN